MTPRISIYSLNKKLNGGTSLAKLFEILSIFDKSKMFAGALAPPAPTSLGWSNSFKNSLETFYLWLMFAMCLIAFV